MSAANVSDSGWLGEFAQGMGREHDLRLAGLAGGVWLACWTALSQGWQWAGAAVVLALVGAVVLWRRARAAAVVAALLGVVAGGFSAGVHVWTRDDPAVAGFVQQRGIVPVELRITDDPRPLRSGRGHVIDARLTRVRDTSVDTRVTVLTNDQEWAGLLPGQRLRADVTFRPPRGGDLRAATLSARSEPTLIGVPPWYQRLSGDLRAGLQHACRVIPEPARGLLPGLVLGDTSGLDRSLADDFRRVGMTHLVAVSGANCAIVLGCVVFLLGRTRAGPRTIAIVSALALIAFVVLVRPSPSVLRAAAMGMIGLIGLAIGRPRVALPALCAGIVVLILVDPELSTDVGFALSVCATAGLLLLAPPWRDGLVRRGVPKLLADAVSVPAAAQVACGPLIAVVSASVSLVAVPANFLAAPAVAPATLLGVAATAVSPLWPDAAAVLAWLAGWSARWLVFIAHNGADLPGGALPWLGGVAGGLLLAALTLLLLGAARFRTLRTIALTIALGIAIGAVPVRIWAPGWPPPGWVFAACDVGQGDALVVSAGPGAAVVVDAGPEPDAIDTCLSRLGVQHVPMIVISHFHADHVDGLPGVLADRSIGTVLVPEFSEPSAGYQLVRELSPKGKAEVVIPQPGNVYRIGEATLEVIGPTKRLTGTRSDPNENSLIVRATVGGVRVLLTGDAEHEEQHELSREDLRADILKVPHHGSSFQDPTFLASVKASIAVISVGARNSYGHPNPALIETLIRDGTQVFRTDHDGDIAVSGQPGELAVTHRRNRARALPGIVD